MRPNRSAVALCKVRHASGSVKGKNMMHQWRLPIALTLGLIWYFSDYFGRTVTQYFVCFLFCLSIPLLFGNNGRESSTQTDEETKEHPLQETAGEESFHLTHNKETVKSNSLSSQCPHVKKSLRQVFECAYARHVQPWYGVPEPREYQPLHRVLSREVDFVIDRIIERSRDFDICQAVVGSIRILTQHFHNAKQSDREPLFSSAAVEVAVLRELSDALIRNLCPKSFWGQEINHCVLNEIIALKGLRQLVNWLANPDNLNQLVVNLLDSVALKSPADEQPVDQASQEGDGDVEGGKARLPGAENSPGSVGSKRRRHRIRVGWSRFVGKMRSKKAKKKKMKKLEQDLILSIMAAQRSMSEDDASSIEGSLLNQDDSEREDSDLEDYLASVQEDLMEFKLSYEMWRVGCWTVSIPQVDCEEEELIFTIHLEEKDSPENLQWDIKKTYKDIVFFRNRWQDSTSLPTILQLDESNINDEVKEEARASVRHFLQELVSDNAIGYSQPVFQFLCPLDKLLSEKEHYDGVWGLLSGLAYFLTPGQEEEENSNPQTEVPKESPMPDPDSSAPTVENHLDSEGSRDFPASALPTVVISQYNTPPRQPNEAETNPAPQPAVNSGSWHENSSQGKSEDSDNTFTSHLKLILKGLTRSRSQESLASAKSSGEEEQLDEAAGSQQEGLEGLSQLRVGTKLNKKEKTIRTPAGGNKSKGKETRGAPQRGDESQRGQVNWEQLEATKAIFDLLKEISGNSILFNIFDAILKPVMPILKKKINTFLNKLNPTEEQMTVYIDTLRDKLWPKLEKKLPLKPPPLPRSDDEKKETKDRAHDLINARYSSCIILKKTDVESIFNILQNSEENKILLYTLLSFLLKQFLPNENLSTTRAAVLQKRTNN
ncbi:uncharacterized protein si:rp71-46j2.7 isoform X2 [Austrofundulus limnaeus]|uniref:Uncharacterized protein si:rp71-46j2.7 isoform X2 n=1 Tax=Austrofundulus limnaeus TaxID=52670 RepID=A0A2I4AZ55_AUSLI|nr:PREDICTED: uncharacterized protein LOC106515475 isoform X2 [Austrofundulus limnaeus]